MERFVEGVDRGRSTLFPAALDDDVTEDNPVRAVDVFVDGLDLTSSDLWEASRSTPAAPVITPALRSSFTSNLNRIPSSRRLEPECQRNIEMIWLTGRLAPDFKTIADFRKDNGRAIREVCRAVPQA
jgi:transposase